jgi:hypothetical protein
VKVLFTILTILSFSAFAQESSEENASKRKKKESYFGVHSDLVYSRIEGIEGNERRVYLEDYIQDLNFNGIAAEGGVTGRYASTFGVFYDRFVGQRFAIHIQASYLQTGYNEKLIAVGSTDAGDIEEVRNFKARLDYLSFLGGIKYYNDFGITLTLAGLINYNIIDKVKNEELKISTGRFGTTEVRKDEDLFLHEYFGNNRVVFLTGGAFSAGYRWKEYEVDFSFKITSQILSERDDMFLHLFQIGFKYQLPKPD